MNLRLALLPGSVGDNGPISDLWNTTVYDLSDVTNNFATLNFSIPYLNLQ